MSRLIINFLVLAYLLNSCNSSSNPFSQSMDDSTSPPNIQEKNGCIPPLTSFAFQVNKSSNNDTSTIPPSDPWRVVTPLPEKLLDSQAFDLISFARARDGYNEIWLKRQYYFETKNAGRQPRIQFLIYQTDTDDWSLIPEKFDENSAKSGLIYMTINGTIWADFSFSGSRHFAVYNEVKSKFEIVAGSENVPQGNRLLDDDEKFWILASKDGIYSYDTVSNKIENHLSIPDLETNSSLYGSMATLASDGSIYFLSMTGEEQVRLMHYIPKTNQLEFVPNLDYLGDIPYNLFMDWSDRLWFGDLGWRESDGTWYRIVRSPVFITDRVLNGLEYSWSFPSIILESSDGLLWFRSDNGMTWLDPQKGKWCWFTTYQSNIVEDQGHNLWMIADGNLYQNPLNP